MEKVVDKINLEIEKAEAKGDIKKAQFLRLKKMGVLAKRVKDKDLRKSLIAETTRMMKDYQLAETKDISTERSKRLN